MHTQANQIDMTQGSIVRKLIKFSLPFIASSILQLLFNAADIAVVGRFAGDNSLAAVGSTTALINLLVNLFMGLSVGTNVVASHFFGAKDSRRVKQTVHTAVVLSVVSGIILTILGVCFTEGILRLMSAPEEVLPLSALYLRVFFGGITSTMIYNFGSALLRAKGDTKRPLIILFGSGILNVILNLIFVICFDMDVAGVALATVISQTIAAILVIILLIREKGDFHLSFKKLFDYGNSVNGFILGRIIKIGLPAGFQSVMFAFSNIIIQSSVNSFGAIVVAGNSAASTIEGFIYTSMNGFSQCALTFCSQNMGAKKYERINKVVVSTMIINFTLGLVLGWAAVFFGRPLLSIFTTGPEVIDAGMYRLWCICTTYCLCGLMDGMSNCIRGIGHSVAPVVTTLAGACAFRVIWLFTLFQIPQFHNPFMIFVTYPLSWIITFTANIILYRKYIKELVKD